MASQTLTFVVLPNGETGKDQLRLSILLTPRLENGATLTDFPDFLNWPRLLRDNGMTFQIVCAGNSVSASIDPSVLRPDIWQAVFRPNTRVAPYAIPDYDRRLFVSYPTRDAMTYVKFAYQYVAVHGAAAGDENRFLGSLLRDLVFRDRDGSTLDAALSELRIEMWRQQNDGRASRAGAFARGLTPADAAALPPDGIPTVNSVPPGTRQMASRFALFHRMPPAPGRPPLPHTPADFARVMDFHQALTALSSYPTLLRALGLVFDLTVPAEFCAFSPAIPGGDYFTIAVSGIKAAVRWAHRPTLFLPDTAYYRAGASFTAAPATPSADLNNGDYLPGDVIDGVVALTPDTFHLNEIDVDGALLKTMAFADNVANARSSLEIDSVLPSMRSAGIALMADGRAMQLLQKVVENKAFDAALQGNEPIPRPFNVLDLVRGYRFDIWSSLTGKWHSLHQRHATYRFGAAQRIVLTTTHEEGFTQPAAASPADDPTRPPDPASDQTGTPQPGTDMFIHERVAAWTGWSLSVSRPGMALNRSADPSVATDPDPTLNDPKTPFKMVAEFSPAPGTLPELRFGARYRMRARAVDLAGNSILPQHHSATDVVLPPAGALPYLRFDPVPHPVLVLREPTSAGASLDRLVIRTYNTDESLDTVPTAELDQRHVAPPQAAVRLAEQHGMFDNVLGKLRGDAATFGEIVARDKGQFKKKDGVPIDSVAQLAVPYLPDPIARGAALQNLPNTNNDTTAEVVSGVLRYTTRPDVQLIPGSVIHIDFGPAWPERKPFRVVIREGVYLPQWDNAARVLTVYLQKAQVVDVPLSCYLNSDDLSMMGVWDWMREYLEAAESASMQNPSAAEAVPLTSDAFALLTRQVLDGRNPMLTPPKILTLVHATQQPLGRPQFTLLPIVHGAAPPIPASTLQNGFTAVTSWRSALSHHAYLLGAIAISGKSTSKIDIQGRWREFVDDVSQPKPQVKPASAHVETIDLTSLSGGPIPVDPVTNRYVAVYIPQVDVLWFAAPFDTLPGVSAPPSIAAPMHRFSDTRHRRVFYDATATSRFKEYFPGPNLKFTRTGDPLLVEVPSSARPASPQLDYIVPTFGVERQESTNVKTDVRFGNGVRVYLRRPWYSSGEGELLGVVLWSGSAPSPTQAEREKYKHLFTQWGLDPIWQTGGISDIPAVYQFPSSIAQGTGLTLEEAPFNVDVAGHPVAYDDARKLWFCDITFENYNAYRPFVRMALARYQPNSIPGVELSNTVLADYVQLSPDRSAVVSVDPADPATARVYVGGLAPEGPNLSRIFVSVERRLGNIESDLAWEPAPSPAVVVAPDAPAPSQPDAVLWSGTVAFPAPPPAGRYRIVITEYEVLAVDPSLPQIRDPLGAVAGRIVYAAVIPYDFPSSAPDK